MTGYIDLDTWYRLTHRLQTNGYDIRDISEMLPYEREIYLALYMEDEARKEDAMKRAQQKSQ